MDHWTKENKELFTAFLKLRTETEFSCFCRDLMTLTEIKEFSKRWQIAKMLNEGKMSYQQIAEKIGTSTATVTRVNQWLNHGLNGYKTVLRRMSKSK